MAANDTARLLMELETMASTLISDADVVKLKLRFEEVANNYSIDRKTPAELENDFTEKIDYYLNALRLEGYSEQTLYGNKLDLNKFSEHVNKAVVQVTTSDVRSYLASRPDWSAGTVAKKLSTLKAFYKWMQAEEFILRDPTAKIRTPKQEKRLPKAISPNELEKVRDACESTRDRALVEVFYSTGCRLSELIGMRTEQIDWKTGSLPVIGKGNKERDIFLTAETRNVVNQYLETRGESEYGNVFLSAGVFSPTSKCSSILLCSFSP